MSASKEKQKRQLEYEELGYNPYKKSKAKNKKKERSYFKTIALTLAGLFVLLFFLSNTNVLISANYALKIGKYTVSVSEYNFAYYMAIKDYTDQVSSYYSDYGYSISDITGIDFSKSLKNQKFAGDESITWAQYFRNMTVSALTEHITIYDKATAEGFKMKEDDQSYIDTLPASLKENAQSENKSLNGFLKDTFGAGVTVKTIQKYMKRRIIVQDYYEAKREEQTYTDEELAAEYEKNKNNYDLFTFRAFLVSSTREDEQDSKQSDERQDEIAKDQADKMLKEITESNFAAKALQYAQESEKEKYEQSNSTMMNRSTISRLTDNYMPADVTEWLADAERKAGDKKVIKDSENGGYWVLYFIERENLDYKAVNVRHILISFKDEEGSGTQKPTPEQNKTALDEATKIYDEWKNGEKTQDSFAALAKTKSDDNADEGGLYENIVKGNFVYNFDRWMYDPSRKAGNTEIVETEYGYHLVYFVGLSEKIQYEEVCGSTIKDEKLLAFAEEIMAEAPAVKYGLFGLYISAEGRKLDKIFQ